MIAVMMRDKLPPSLCAVLREMEDRIPDWSTRPCPDCGAVPVVQPSGSAFLVHRKMWCKVPEEARILRVAELMQRRIRSRWS